MGKDLNTKQLYRKFCETQDEMSIFSKDWYLDAVTQGTEWGVLLHLKNEQVVASMPYYHQKKGFYNLCIMPLMTKMMGPYLIPELRRRRHEIKIYKDFINRLPICDFFSQNFHYDVKNWLPFYWNGFKQSTYYSYIIPDLSDLELVYQNISSNYRNNKIKRAEGIVKCRTDLSIEDYYKVQKLSFERQGLSFPFTLDYFKNYDAALAAKQARQMFFAVDSQNRIHSVAYLIWDKQRAYYHLTGDDPELRSSGAGIFLGWKAMEYTKNVLGLNVFDFEGSMIPSIEHVRRQFGAVQQPYFTVSKYFSFSYKLLKALRG